MRLICGQNRILCISMEFAYSIAQRAYIHTKFWSRSLTAATPSCHSREFRLCKMQLTNPPIQGFLLVCHSSQVVRFGWMTCHYPKRPTVSWSSPQLLLHYILLNLVFYFVWKLLGSTHGFCKRWRRWLCISFPEWKSNFHVLMHATFIAAKDVMQSPCIILYAQNH